MLYFFTFIQGKEKLIYSIGMCEQKNVYQNTRWHLTYFSYLEPILPNTVKVLKKLRLDFFLICQKILLFLRFRLQLDLDKSCHKEILHFYDYTGFVQFCAISHFITQKNSKTKNYFLTNENIYKFQQISEMNNIRCKIFAESNSKGLCFMSGRHFFIVG